MKKLFVLAMMATLLMAGSAFAAKAPDVGGPGLLSARADFGPSLLPALDVRVTCGTLPGLAPQMTLAVEKLLAITNATSIALTVTPRKNDANWRSYAINDTKRYARNRSRARPAFDRRT